MTTTKMNDPKIIIDEAAELTQEQWEKMLKLPKSNAQFISCPPSDDIFRPRTESLPGDQ